MPDKKAEKRSRVTSLTTPHGRLVYHERLPGEAALFPAAIEIAKNGRGENYAFSTTKKQDKKAGALRLLPSRRKTLSVSMVLQPPLHISRSGILWMIGGVAACKVLERNSICNPKIGWIGDVYDGERPLAIFHHAGQLQSSGFWDYLVLSVEISLDEDDYVDRLSDVVNRVFSNRNADLGDRIAEDFLAEFFALYEAFSVDGSFADEYNKRILYKNWRAHTVIDGKTVRGRADYMTESGQLVLRGRGKKKILVTNLSSVKGLV